MAKKKGGTKTLTSVSKKTRQGNSKFTKLFEPLISTETVWKPHVLLLMGDYFASKNENMKAKDFYLQILSSQGLQKDFYEHARSKLSEITND